MNGSCCALDILDCSFPRFLLRREDGLNVLVVEELSELLGGEGFGRVSYHDLRLGVVREPINCEGCNHVFSVFGLLGHVNGSKLGGQVDHQEELGLQLGAGDVPQRCPCKPCRAGESTQVESGQSWFRPSVVIHMPGT